ncbi:hypothetical protein GCM10011390_13130 [Aureimonas endophytica]|uniref:Uncharacterized protein n=2 Tax=Aureimonas endophytica TaxID=2027858 RepID=A0A916ZH89_9HYPH|nr:hypothetical protein GCM10011390_13130 [Aureimonas endophytica]
MARLPVGRAERFRPPRRVPDGIERAFLVEKLRAGLDGQLVLLRAPAGYGKTELLAGAFHGL